MRLMISTLLAATVIAVAPFTGAHGQTRELVPQQRQAAPEGGTPSAGPVELRPGQRLIVQGGRYLLHHPNGTVVLAQSNDCVIDIFANSGIVLESRVVWIVTGDQRRWRGVYAGMQTHRPSTWRVPLQAGDYLVRKSNLVAHFDRNDRAIRTYPMARIEADSSGNIHVVSVGRRVRAGNSCLRPEP